MTVAYLGLGANLGDARQTLKDAVVCLAQQHTITVLAKSSFYRTAPIDAGGDDYFNCVVKVETTLPVRHLLALCHKIEHQFGRERPFRNAPRTLDLDILLYGDQSIDEADLIVPHPRLTERAFALVPLVEIDAALIIPRYGRAEALLDGVRDQRIEKVKSPCQCPMLNALAAGAPAVDKGRCE
ncbi:2-amino-4-hydroxy-6-hydroxymethyldihydropteridine pyrophosphokinase [Paraburkholderia caffeinilytica]|uniref:2-amino-4-hydroxy-6-hydroxymethyldihydropteridine pyrophosphokinase n=1 Tax=Paraburkholderia caffeinilytica TaxID=1761016 RepID=A0ABQ1N8E3_9BURK|nr:2-amino-4-hydroxy-6-hydroxymethyldihydropteridine diphosphokinase [Paraburkholderia caffeinilytica]AXL52772.1 2-amino-4-hydroxy-6-hydroxymethyldihydropteridine pyrophosphokinase [Paraburkholderia caffeinilytica]GGC59103.1 2-amino-4-hydroxy-6-hydroxymethyldihydropteridine diphosphokinase [Paraburkholderia caffeinilytica]CAB3803193.1 2-amino-4-hydroxy-6-hydroxymethyldihydropteridinepyrophosphokinase [Paraburkholderia caffeinilytica]